MCTRCGAPVLYADLEGSDWAVEAGSVPSMNFRKDAVAFLETATESLNPLEAEKLLARERVRVVEGIRQDTAEALAQRLGRKETAARVSRGPTPKAGLAGSFRNGLPLVGVAIAVVLGLTWSPIGWAIGGALAAALGVMNARREMPVLAQAPVGAYLEDSTRQAIKRYAAVREKLDATSQQALDTVTQTAFEVVARSSDPNDVVALSTGGLEGGLADNAMKVATKAVGIAEAVVRGGRDAFTAEEQEQLARLRVAAEGALEGVAGLGSGGSVEALENKLAEEVELVRETVDELDYLGS